MGIPQSSASVVEDLYSDKNHVLKKVTTSMTMTAMTVRTEMVDMDAKAGAPDESFFKVPSEWGTCVKAETPPAPATDNPIALAFLKCLGMHDGQAVLTV